MQIIQDGSSLTSWLATIIPHTDSRYYSIKQGKANIKRLARRYLASVSQLDRRSKKVVKLAKLYYQESYS